MRSKLQVLGLYLLSVSVFVYSVVEVVNRTGLPHWLEPEFNGLIKAGFIVLAILAVGVFIFTTGYARMVYMRDRKYVTKSKLRRAQRWLIQDMLVLAFPGGNKTDQYYEVLRDQELIARHKDKPWEAPEAHREGYAQRTAARGWK